MSAEAFGALRGTRARWLRHRGHALSWAQHEGALYLAFGGADLEDALPADEEPPWEPERGGASLWVNLSSAMDLEGLSGGLEITLQPSEEGLEMAFHQGRESATSVRSVLESGLSWLQGTPAPGPGDPLRGAQRHVRRHRPPRYRSGAPIALG